MEAFKVSLDSTLAPSYNLSPDNISEARDEFSEFLSQSGVVTDPEVCFVHSNTRWSVAKPDERPNIVLFPQSTNHVSSIMRICSKRKIPVTVFSGGTSMSGALTSTRGGVCINFSRMNHIVAIHGEDMDAVVQPGIRQSELNESLSHYDLFFPPDPSPDAMLGGMIAMSCSGTNAYRYGTIKDWIISLTLVLADGSIVKTRNRPRKSSAGYDLTRLIIGSEGTLGLVTEATIKVATKPRNIHVAIVTFPDIFAATRTSLKLTCSGILFDAIELLDDTSLRAINISKLSSKHWTEKPTLFLKFSGSVNEVLDKIKFGENAANENNCETFDASGELEVVELWWGARKCVGKALLSLKQHPSDIFLPSDAAVPISHISELMIASQNLLVEANMTGSIVSHLGDGNIHVVVICPQQQLSHAQSIISKIQDLALKLEGTVTGEHGIGLALRDKLIEEVGDKAIGVMRAIKLALDPLYLLNPDKIFRAVSGSNQDSLTELA